MIRSIDVEELTQILNEKKDLNVLDVQRKVDYAASPLKIPGAAWLDPENASTWIDLQPGDKLKKLRSSQTLCQGPNLSRRSRHGVPVLKFTKFR